MKKNILLTIEYDGTNFCGWHKQVGDRTVQGELEKVLSRVCNTKIQANGTSRTDTGVHALGQRVSFTGDFGIPTDRIQRVVNNMLSADTGTRMKGGDIRIACVEEKPIGFHARFDAKGKKYRYVIRNESEKDLFRRNYCYQVETPLDVDAMKRAAAQIVGTHDFASFQAMGGTPRTSSVRTVYTLEVDKNAEGDIIIEITGNGFLYNMVRIIAGTLVDVGRGKIADEDISGIIASTNRRKAGHTAPPGGLYLVEIYYNEFEEREAATHGTMDRQ